MVDKELEQVNVRSKLFKALSIVFFVFVNIVLIIIKLSTDKINFSLWWIFGIEIILIIISIVIFFSDKFYNVIRDKKEEISEKLPKQITYAQAYEIAEKSLKSHKYLDYIDEVLDEGTEEHGESSKSNIYFIKCKGKYTKQIYFIALNMHYPEENIRIMINPSLNQIARAKQYLAKNPKNEPDIEVTEMDNPILGTKVKTTKKISKKENENEKKQEKGEVE